MIKHFAKRLAVVALATTATLWSAGSASARKNDDLPVFGPGSSYHPRIDPEEFSADVTNRWFPLTPGTTLTYQGTKDGERARDVVFNTFETKVIDGVRCRVVLDRLFLEGKLAERTFDYYAQDDHGNVWYFGEDTVALDDNGNLTDTEGSFHAGVDGAQPGVFMQAHPDLGRMFRQEWYEGHAEDTFVAVSRTANVTVPYGTFHAALKTVEQTALEPGVLDNKYYARGVGEVVEVSVQGPLEELELVAISRVRQPGSSR